MRAFKETCKSAKTSRARSYAANVDRDNSPTKIFSEIQQDYTEALANLAMARKVGREAVSLLTKTISKIIFQVTTLIKNFATVNKNIVSLKHNSNRGSGGGGGGGGGGETKNRDNDATGKSDCFGHVVGAILT